MSDRSDGIVDGLVDKLGGVIRDHMKANRSALEEDGIVPALNALAIVSALTITGALERFPSAPVYFRTALAAQMDRNLSNPKGTTK